jgi:L-fuculose-phosphate aldolase
VKAPKDTKALRQSVIDGCRLMNARGLNQSTSGNISVRVEGGMLITPSGVPYDAMKPEMLVMLPLEGTPAKGLNPSSEWRFHQRLMATRTDMNAVVHAHPPYCSVLAVQRREIPACHYMIAAFGGEKVPLAGYSLFGSEALAAEVARTMTSYHGCLMANHGATVVGETLDKALWRLEELETIARTYYLSDPAGKPVILSSAEVAEAAASFATYGLARTDR